MRKPGELSLNKYLRTGRGGSQFLPFQEYYDYVKIVKKVSGKDRTG